ncbi:MAG TPA: cytidylate kinase-like family protein [Bacteroidales bacterium]|jgi:cytidylate kinase|nr:cytidylate kinase-like family protein [Bacteroidales bacterium]
MNIDLLKYVSDRIHEEGGKGKETGPVITLSREYGCPAKIIAGRLAEELTRKLFAKGKDIKWKYVTKEIMAESAKALEIDPEKIKYVFQYEQKSMVDDIISAQFNKYYKSERKIRNTVARVIRNMAAEGHVIIVGRGGVAITHDISRSLHIMLEAPLEWRTVRIAENFKISLEEAKKAALDVDKKRKEFREYFQGKDSDYTRFDMNINCMSFSIEEIVHIILRVAEIRKLV